MLLFDLREHAVGTGLKMEPLDVDAGQAVRNKKRKAHDPYPFGSILAVRRPHDLRLRHVVRIRHGFPDFFFLSHVRQIVLGGL